MTRKSKELKLLLVEDDCAPDAREYFNKTMKEKYGVAIVDFHSHGTLEQKDDTNFTWYYKGYILTNNDNDPYYRLYKEESEEGEEMSDDSWKHRSLNMRCHTCMWFVFKEPMVPPQQDKSSIGRCRRHAPTISGYPVVYNHDWCGDHKLDENKI